MNVFDFLFPPHCISCHKLTQNQHSFYSYLCPQCLKKINLTKDNFCYGCYQPNLWGGTCQKCKKIKPLNGLIIASSYQNPILKEAIHYFKYYNIKSLSLTLSWLVMQKIKNFPWRNKKDWLFVPVPLAKKRLKFRGFNQAKLIAHNLAFWLGIPISSDIIKRIKFRLPQMEVQNQKERIRNISGCFKINKNFNLVLLKNKKIMLIDDVITTGATLNECANLLRPHVKEVWGCVIAK